MPTRNKLVLALAAAAVVSAQSGERSSVKVNLPADSPVSLLSADWGESRTSERGSASILNLNTSLSLRNSGNRRIRAISWMVTSQEVTPGGRASVTRASLDIGPGETFPLRVDLRLLRPLAIGDQLVERLVAVGVVVGVVGDLERHQPDERRQVIPGVALLEPARFRRLERGGLRYRRDLPRPARAGAAARRA